MSQLADKEEIQELQKAFKQLDISRTGVISRNDLLQGYKDLMGETAEAEVDRIFAIADSDNSGAIDYSEWVVATIDKKKLLSDENIRHAFKLFDKDGGGSISPDEIKQVLGAGRKFDDRIWDQILDEFDIDGNGEVDYDEFKDIIIRCTTSSMEYIEEYQDETKNIDDEE